MWPYTKKSFRDYPGGPWVGKFPWRREWQPTPIFLLGEFHEERSLAGYMMRLQRVRHDCVTNTSLVVQWLRICTSTAGSMGLSLVALVKEVLHATVQPKIKEREYPFPAMKNCGITR